MRKSGLTSATLQHLRALSDKSPFSQRRGDWEDEAEGVSIEEGLDMISDDELSSNVKDDQEFSMGDGGEFTEDSVEDYSGGLLEEVRKKDAPVIETMGPEPWNDAWELTAQFNPQKEYQDALSEPISISVYITVEMWDNVGDAEESSFEKHVREYLRKKLNMGQEQHLLVDVNFVTPDNLATENGVSVTVDLDGVPSEAYDSMQDLVNMLVFEAASSYLQDPSEM